MINKEETIQNLRTNYKNVFPPPVLDLLIYLIGGGQADTEEPGETFILSGDFEGSFAIEGDEDSVFQPIWQYPITKDGYALLYTESQMYTEFDDAENANKPSKSLRVQSQYTVVMYDGDGTTILISDSSNSPKNITVATSSSPFQFNLEVKNDNIVCELWDNSVPTQLNLKTKWKMKINVVNVTI